MYHVVPLHMFISAKSPTHLSILDFRKIGDDLGILQPQTEALPDSEELFRFPEESPFLGDAEGEGGVDPDFEVLAVLDGGAESGEHVFQPNRPDRADQQRNVPQHVAQGVARVPAHLVWGYSMQRLK